MEPDAANMSPGGSEPKRRENGIDSTHSVSRSIILDIPVREVYACCCRIEESPRFIGSVREVQKIDDCHFLLTCWSGNSPHRAVLQIILRVPERRLVWQAISRYFPRGVILFEPLSDHRTEITVKLSSNVEADVLAKVTVDYLISFKKFMEQGTSR